MIRKYQKSDREFMLAMMEDFYSSPAVLHAIPKENYIKTLNEVESNSPFADIFVLKRGRKSRLCFDCIYV